MNESDSIILNATIQKVDQLETQIKDLKDITDLFSKQISGLYSVLENHNISLLDNQSLWETEQLLDQGFNSGIQDCLKLLIELKDENVELKKQIRFIREQK